MQNVYTIRLFLSTFMLFVFFNIYGQLNDDFCHDWCGYWHGEMGIYRVDSMVNTVSMSLLIERTEHPDTLKYILQYGGQDKRDYRLVWVDRKKGILQVDEQNSIVIPTYYYDDRLISHFEVEGSSIISELRRDGELLRLTFTTLNAKEPYLSGGRKEIPEVKSYHVVGFQKALLSRN
jgi:hypothetical protein